MIFIFIIQLSASAHRDAVSEHEHVPCVILLLNSRRISGVWKGVKSEKGVREGSVSGMEGITPPPQSLMALVMRSAPLGFDL